MNFFDYFNNLFSDAFLSMGSLGSSVSTLPTMGMLSGSATVEAGFKTMNNEEYSLSDTAGCLVTSFGTAVSLNAFPSYLHPQYKVAITQEYIESMNEEELSTFIEYLEKKEIELDDTEEKIYHL